jgi:hypothetical protein
VTTPHEEQPAGQRPAVPTVSTAPPRSRWRFSSVPAHVGPARTSTVVLAVVFVLLLALHGYLQSSSDSGYTTVTTNTGQQVRVKTTDLSGTPAAPTSATAPATTAPRSTAPQSTTTGPPTSTRTPAVTTAPQSTSSPTASGTTGGQSTGSSTAPSVPLLPTSSGAPTS